MRNDVDRLRRLGYPVDATAGRGGGYRLGRRAALPPLLLDDDEAVAVAVGLRAAAGGDVAGIEETSLRALPEAGAGAALAACGAGCAPCTPPSPHPPPAARRSTPTC